jgi:hypothetical protein
MPGDVTRRVVVVSGLSDGQDDSAVSIESCGKDSRREGMVSL